MVLCCLLFLKRAADFHELNRGGQTLHLGSKLLFLPFFSFSVSFWDSSFHCGDVGAATARCGKGSLAGAWGGSSSEPGSKRWLGRHMEKHGAGLACLGRNVQLKSSFAGFQGSTAS